MACGIQKKKEAEEAIKENKLSEELSNWIKWANDKADWFDPLVNKNDDLLTAKGKEEILSPQKANNLGFLIRRYVTADGSEIETIGDKWTDFMISKYKTNTQPLYVITDLEGNNLNSKTPTMSYDPDVLVYENWLKTGISNFKK